MDVRDKVILLLLSILSVFVSGCAVHTPPPVTRIALLAPFEGHTREIGYQALYSVRLALAESEQTSIELIALDDGGTLKTAQTRALAIAQDPQIIQVILLGSRATHPSVIAQLRPTQTPHIVGHWPTSGDMTLHDIALQSEAYICGDICTLQAFRDLAPSLTAVTIETTSSLPTDDFTAKYIASDIFVPIPLPIAYNVYQVTHSILGHKQIQLAPHRYHYHDGRLEKS